MAWITSRWGNILPHMSLGEWFAAHLAITNRYSDNMGQRGG